MLLSPLYPVEQNDQKMGSIWRYEMGVKDKQPMQKPALGGGRTDNSSMKKPSHTEPHSCRGHDQKLMHKWVKKNTQAIKDHDLEFNSPSAQPLETLMAVL